MELPKLRRELAKPKSSTECFINDCKEPKWGKYCKKHHNRNTRCARCNVKALEVGAKTFCLDCNEKFRKEMEEALILSLSYLVKCINLCHRKSFLQNKELPLQILPLASVFRANSSNELAKTISLPAARSKSCLLVAVDNRYDDIMQSRLFRFYVSGGYHKLSFYSQYFYLNYFVNLHSFVTGILKTLVVGPF